MSEQTCAVCGVPMPYRPDEERHLPPDLCGECYAAGLKWMARQARTAAEVCPKCGKVHPPAPTLPTGFRRGCGRPDCPVCNPKPAAVPPA
jgi:NMD protein affecting ribosome stability and mRNA decay